MSATRVTPSPQFRHAEVLCIIEALFAGGVSLAGVLGVAYVLLPTTEVSVPVWVGAVLVVVSAQAVTQGMSRCVSAVKQLRTLSKCKER